MKDIKIRGARTHNLKNVSLTIPRDSLVVITGVSGSGKSSLAFDTLYAEGQRRYVESLSSYARQFLGVMDKPDVDSIEGLSPAIAIEQKALMKNPRSTVGTTTEIYDYLRMLYAHCGEVFCPECGMRVKAQTMQDMMEHCKAIKTSDFMVAAPVIVRKKGSHEEIFKRFIKEGLYQFIVDGVSVYAEHGVPKLNKNTFHTIQVVVDVLSCADGELLENAITRAHAIGEGVIEILTIDADGAIASREQLSMHQACRDCGISFETLDPRFFSFNAPLGACECCGGLGDEYRFDPALVVPDHSKAVAEGAIKGLRAALGESFRIERVAEFMRVIGASTLVPFKNLSAAVQQAILYGPSEEFITEVLKNKKHVAVDEDALRVYEGVIPLLQRLHKQADSEWRKRDFASYMCVQQCESCQGKRLSKKARSVKIQGRSIIDVTEQSIGDLVEWFATLSFGVQKQAVAVPLIREISARLNFLNAVGLGYIDVARRMETLSGGEAQRVQLATQIGSALSGVMYVLDEPSIGLHQRDNDRLIGTLKNLRDLGNTVIVVEHDEDTMRSADQVIDVGIGAGVHGGSIIAQGSAAEIEQCPQSLTGQYLAGFKQVSNRKRIVRKAKAFFTVHGAREHNLKNITLKIPCGLFNVITGVSGSGKSTLVNDIIARGIAAQLYGSKERVGVHDSIEHSFEQIVIVDQSPIGRTPRSNPATYVKIFDDIRKLFAGTREAHIRGYKEGRFSFNVSGGRCEACEGDGVIRTVMHFLPDVYVTCESCCGRRYNAETLEILYKDKNIYQVLDMTVDEALEFFAAVPSLYRKLTTLKAVGLGYVKLGQSATTLSGGEAQRIKLSRELAKKSTEKTLYVLDEPTTGLHFDDISRLLKTIDALVDKGATCLVIEHNLDVIAHADHIIDLGPEGGKAGGNVVIIGTPREVSACKDSQTGIYLKKFFDKKKHIL
ncbi:MAG: UvrABC system protein A [candidate division TM6 bacterium GW2011_GWE2_41_16]|nr:MAG: UvrABC system protein A [candidate division TM6 bacterium GW2011_GWE2_41_16]